MNGDENTSQKHFQREPMDISEALAAGVPADSQTHTGLGASDGKKKSTKGVDAANARLEEKDYAGSVYKVYTTR